jgi:hypothetical protein
LFQNRIYLTLNRKRGVQLVAPQCFSTDIQIGFDSVEMPEVRMIRKLKSGEYRLYSRKKNAKTGKRRNLGTFRTRKQAQATRARSAVLQATPLTQFLAEMQERFLQNCVSAGDRSRVRKCARESSGQALDLATILAIYAGLA